MLTRCQAGGTARPSILKNLLTQLEINGPPSHGLQEQEDVIRWTTATLFGGMFSRARLNTRLTDSNELDLAAADTVG